MKKILIISGVVVALIILVVAALVFVFRSAPEDVEHPDINFPSGTSTGQGGMVSTMTIPSRSGEPIQVQDFLHNGVTTEDAANPGSYYLAGRDALCELSGDCYTGAPADDFTIVYHAGEKAFAIGLTKEPLGDARRHAEQFLLKTLGISQSALCAINYYLTTDEGTNAQYAGEDLGFSFCDDAVPLP